MKNSGLYTTTTEFYGYNALRGEGLYLQFCDGTNQRPWPVLIAKFKVKLKPGRVDMDAYWGNRS